VSLFLDNIFLYFYSYTIIPFSLNFFSSFNFTVFSANNESGRLCIKIAVHRIHSAVIVSFVHQLKLLYFTDEFYFTYAVILLSPVFTYTSVVYGYVTPCILPCSRFRSICNISNYV